jgi:hypothetical protein
MGKEKKNENDGGGGGHHAEKGDGRERRGTHKGGKGVVCVPTCSLGVELVPTYPSGWDEFPLPMFVPCAECPMFCAQCRAHFFANMCQCQPISQVSGDNTHVTCCAMSAHLSPHMLLVPTCPHLCY